MSFVEASKTGSPQLIQDRKLGSIIPNALMLEELSRFFSNSHFDLLVDVGSGTVPYQTVYEKHCHTHFGFDVATSLHNLANVDFMASAMAIPLRAKTADMILCSEVLEHLPEPAIALREMARIAKPGAKLFLTTPFMLSVHEAPYDYYRYTEYGLSYLLEKAGFEVETLLYKGEVTGVWLVRSLWFQTKFWWLCRKLTGMSIIYSTKNPFIWAGVLFPQYVYLKLYRWLRQKYPKLLQRLAETTLGYIVIARRV